MDRNSKISYSAKQDGINYIFCIDTNNEYSCLNKKILEEIPNFEVCKDLKKQEDKTCFS